MSWISRLAGWHDSSGPGDADDVRHHGFDAHLDRNEFQQGLAPDHAPGNVCYVDPETQVVWEPDNGTSAAVFHGGNDCYRGTLPEQRVEDLRIDPHYRAAFDQINGGHGYNVDTTTPGAQVCFDEHGRLVDTGTEQGTWDYASPLVPGQSAEHWFEDVAPDLGADDYSHFNAYDQGSHADVSHVTANPFDADDQHTSGWEGSDVCSVSDFAGDSCDGPDAGGGID